MVPGGAHRVHFEHLEDGCPGVSLTVPGTTSGSQVDCYLVISGAAAIMSARLMMTIRLLFGGLVYVGTRILEDDTWTIRILN